MTKILKLFIIVMVGLSLTQCKPKEIIVTQTKFDTINIHTIEKVEIPIDNTITISKPCDSLGILKQFKQTFKTNHATVTISNDNGSIVAEINLDSIKQVWQSEYIGKTEIEVVEIPVEVPKPFIPKWVWYVSGTLLLYVVYRVLRIYIPFLKILPY